MTYTNNQTKQTGFMNLGIAPAIFEELMKWKITEPTPIQRQAIPIAIQGKDVIGIAQTGTGKTFAFGIPMIQRIASVKRQGLVVLPTRELALQVDESLQKIGKRFGLRTAVLIGGQSMVLQKRAIAKKPHMIIATPGRLIDHLEQRTVSLSGVGIVVLDEADRMLDMGFEPQIRRIMKELPNERQTMLFSATMPQQILKIANEFLEIPIRVEIAPAGTTADKVAQELFIVQKDKKASLLLKLLENFHGSTLVFTRTKYGAKRLAAQLREHKITAAEIHSNRSLGQRKQALEGFKLGRFQVLVATDIASRGIDVVGIELVVNFDLPSTSDDYVHRIGRTARAGASGRAITFAVPGEQKDVRDIERLIRKPLSVSRLPDMEPLTFQQHSSSRDDRQSGARDTNRGSRQHQAGGYAEKPSSRRRRPSFHQFKPKRSGPPEYKQQPSAKGYWMKRKPNQWDG